MCAVQSSDYVTILHTYKINSDYAFFGLANISACGGVQGCYLSFSILFFLKIRKLYSATITLANTIRLHRNKLFVSMFVSSPKISVKNAVTNIPAAIPAPIIMLMKFELRKLLFTINKKQI